MSYSPPKQPADGIKRYLCLGGDCATLITWRRPVTAGMWVRESDRTEHERYHAEQKES